MSVLRKDTAPFSDVAEDYDSSFTDLPSVKIIRERILDLVRTHFPASGTVLDLACGTGQDSIALSTRGYQVVAADQSMKMLEQAAEKSRALPVPPLFAQVDASALTMFRDSSFDAILSNFGGLNCVSDIHAALEQCHRILRPNGMMLICLLGAHSAWESAAFFVRGDVGSARRRRGTAPVKVRVGNRLVDTWYHSVRSLRRNADGLFDIITIAGLNIIAPPPASRSFSSGHPGLTSFLYAADRLVQSLPLVRACGDHTVFVLRRRELS